MARLLDAGIRAINEVGYARASIQEICSRAGMSHGSLFRHFGSRLDFMAATAQEAARRQLANFQSRFAGAVDDGGDPLEAALRLARESAANSTNVVFYELLIAARTDHDLREKLIPILNAYNQEIAAVAIRLIPGADALPYPTNVTLLSTVLSVLDGEAVGRNIYPEPEIYAERIPLLLALLRGQISLGEGKATSDAN